MSNCSGCHGECEQGTTCLRGLAAREAAVEPRPQTLAQAAIAKLEGLRQELVAAQVSRDGYAAAARAAARDRDALREQVATLTAERDEARGVAERFWRAAETQADRDIAKHWWVQTRDIAATPDGEE